MRFFAVVTAGVLLLGACDSDDASSTGDKSSGTDVAAGDDAVPLTLPDGSVVRLCTDFYGEPTVDVASYFQDGQPCGRDIGLAELEVLYPGIGSQECVDGSFLYWNDVGWGSTDGEWAEGDGLPPDADMAACRGD